MIFYQYMPRLKNIYLNLLKATTKLKAISIKAKINGPPTFIKELGSYYLNFFETAGVKTAFRELPIFGKLIQIPRAIFK